MPPEVRPRRIRLRRPPTLSVIDVPFVPDGVEAVRAEVQRRWQRLCTDNPAFFDGRLYQVLGLHRNGAGGASLHVAECAYRYHAVQDDDFDLGIRALGVKGITTRHGRVLMGRRAGTVARHQGRWEFAPGGVVEPPRDPGEVILRELGEETGVVAAGEPTAIAILEDRPLRCWEIVFAVEASGQGEPTTAEYDELRWCEPGDLPEDLTPISRLMLPLLRRPPT